MKLNKGDRIVFQGDSITDSGRTKPTDDWFASPLGTGYVNVFNGLVNSSYPSHHIDVVNMGVDGNTSSDLLARWEKDTISLRPDWISVMIGVNDIWRHFDTPQKPELCVSISEYEKNLRKYISMSRSQLPGVKFLFISPIYWENNREDPMYVELSKYSLICEKVADDAGELFVNAQKAADGVLEHCYSSYIAWDRVHPNIIGHTVIAKEIAKALEADIF